MASARSESAAASARSPQKAAHVARSSSAHHRKYVRRLSRASASTAASSASTRPTSPCSRPITSRVIRTRQQRVAVPAARRDRHDLLGGRGLHGAPPPAAVDEHRRPERGGERGLVAEPPRRRHRLVDDLLAALRRLVRQPGAEERADADAQRMIARRERRERLLEQVDPSWSVSP